MPSPFLCLYPRVFHTNRSRYQSRAFLILPMTFNIGVIIGPILGGILSDPAHSYPEHFGGNAFFLQFPYATPNLLSTFILFCALLAVWLGLEEVSRYWMRYIPKVCHLFPDLFADILCLSPLSLARHLIQDETSAILVSNSGAKYFPYSVAHPIRSRTRHWPLTPATSAMLAASVSRWIR